MTRSALRLRCIGTFCYFFMWILYAFEPQTSKKKRQETKESPYRCLVLRCLCSCRGTAAAAAAAAAVEVPSVSFWDAFLGL